MIPATESASRQKRRGELDIEDFCLGLFFAAIIGMVVVVFVVAAANRADLDSPAGRVTADEVRDVLDGNPLAAADRWAGKALQVSGPVEEIAPSAPWKTSAVIVHIGESVRCSTPASAKPETLQTGDLVTMTGQVGAVAGGDTPMLRMERCRLDGHRRNL